MRSWFPQLALPLVLAGCEGSRTLRIVPPEGLTDARALLFHFDALSGDGSSFALAVERTNGALGPLIFEDHPWSERYPETPAISVLAYPQPLSELELAPGRLDPPAEPRLCLLAEPTQIFDGAVGEVEVAGWTSRDQISQGERELLIADGGGRPCRRPNLCLPVHAELMDLGVANNIDVMVKLDAQHALIGAESSGYHLADRRGVRPAPEWSGLPTRSAVVAPEGIVWGGGERGLVVYGPAGGPFTEVPVPDASVTIWALAIQPEPRRVLAVGLSGPGQDDPPPLPPFRLGLWEREGDVWVERFLSEVPYASPTQAGVAWIDTDEAWIAFGDIRILYYRAGQADLRVALDVDAVAAPRIDALTMHPRWGLLIGTGEGNLYYQDPGGSRFGAAPDVNFLSPILVVGALGDRLFPAGIGGRVLQTHPLGAPCRQNLSAGSDSSEVVELEGALLLGGGNAEPRFHNRLTWIIPD